MRSRIIIILLAFIASLSAGAQIPFEKKGKWGMIDSLSGEVILKPKYAHISDFTDGYAIAKKSNGKEGVITMSGSELFGCDYDSVMLPLMKYTKHNNEYTLLWAKKNGLWSLHSQCATDGSFLKFNYLFSDLKYTPLGFVGYIADSSSENESGWYLISQSRGNKARVYGEFMTDKKDCPIERISDKLLLIGQWIVNNDGKELYNSIIGFDVLTPSEFIRIHAKGTIFDKSVINRHSGEAIDVEKLIAVGDSVCKIEGHCSGIYICSFIGNNSTKDYAVVNSAGEVLLPFDARSVSINDSKID